MTQLGLGLNLSTKRTRKREFLLLSKFEWARCRVKCGRKPGEANT